MLLCCDAGEALPGAFEVGRGVERRAKVVKCLAGLAERFIGLSAPAQSNRARWSLANRLREVGDGFLIAAEGRD
ncbi:hypothetical protein [Methyloceanibacter sp.]|uniref:hypothetical protein n=1 Tax=Methyloceanibacter sp. TaxID=1965321 RepID=UPI002D1FA446|nr:hypothetical protein [Methyloceanibacter sp.]